jgi:hypothetical protein
MRLYDLDRERDARIWNWRFPDERAIREQMMHGGRRRRRPQHCQRGEEKELSCPEDTNDRRNDLQDRNSSRSYLAS